jgi:hypothetical protein
MVSVVRIGSSGSGGLEIIDYGSAATVERPSVLTVPIEFKPSVTCRAETKHDQESSAEARSRNALNKSTIRRPNRAAVHSAALPNPLNLQRTEASLHCRT